MQACRIVLLALVALIRFEPLTLVAQTPEGTPGHDISSVADAPHGGMVAIPIPDEESGKAFEIPELAGTRPAVGSQLINGRLPRPLADYYVRVGKVTQRISLFEGGLVSVRISGIGGKIEKRLLLPPDAVKVLEEEMSLVRVAEVRDELLKANTPDVTILRVRDPATGFKVERRFSPSVVLPPGLQRCRLILEDLMRAIAQDREVTSSLTGYVPRVGDRLVGEDRKSYEVTRIIRNGELVELRSLDDPTTRYFATKDLPHHFVGAKRTAPN
ncbi:MAG TPA: hypothetical protein VMT00_14075 [Thermoanaerobaculia bacterium]|nr:hypothetical protein [Thermoanaerobaculia bacterium]